MTLWQGAHSETKYLQSSSLTEPHCHPSQTQKSVFFFFLQVWQKLEFLGLSLTLSSKMTSDQKLFCCSAVAHRVGQRPAPTLAAGNC